jgi:hypothetical protein
MSRNVVEASRRAGLVRVGVQSRRLVRYFGFVSFAGSVLFFLDR